MKRPGKVQDDPYDLLAVCVMRETLDEGFVYLERILLAVSASSGIGRHPLDCGGKGHDKGRPRSSFLGKEDFGSERR